MELNRDTINKIRGLILFTVITVIVGINYIKVLGLLAAAVNMAAPFILGAAIAFVLNVPMRRIESSLSHVLKKGSRLLRPVSMALSILLVAGVLFLVMFVVAPQLVRTLLGLQSSIPVFFGEVRQWLEQLFAENPQILINMEQIQIDWQQLFNDSLKFLKNGAGSMLDTTFSAAISIVNGMSTFLIGFIFSIYILLQKENLIRQIKKLLAAFLPERTVEGIVRIAALTSRTFSNFFTGQCVEAVILGSMFFIVLVVLRLPYALLIGVLIAFTALIPVFGAFIGWAVGAFLMLIISPMDALLFSVVFFTLQQIEGNMIYPHVVGNSVGLPSIWVLVAVTLGGSMMGVVGMLIFIPLCSVLYTLLRDTVNERLKRRKLSVKPDDLKRDSAEN
ncbi:AI-2E family transporter [Enterocloster sp.]|uniref:AI-2E family transporter n=1 Tax=Enterocloster sp. TaxID=2719315 RepID=UPI003AB4D43E